MWWMPLWVCECTFGYVSTSRRTCGYKLVNKVDSGYVAGTPSQGSLAAGRR